MQSFFAKKDLARRSAGALDKRSIVALAKNSQALDVVVDGADEDVCPWHAVSAIKEVMEDLATDAEPGLSSGAFVVHRVVRGFWTAAAWLQCVRSGTLLSARVLRCAAALTCETPLTRHLAS